MLKPESWKGCSKREAPTAAYLLTLLRVKADRRAVTLTEFALIGGGVAVGILGLFGVFDDSTWVTIITQSQPEFTVTIGIFGRPDPSS